MIQTDNISTAAYINKLTGPSDPLYYLGRSIQNLIQELNCDLMAKYVPGAENIITDKLSRWQDKNDWMLNPELFKLVDQKWGPHSINRMATMTNYQVKRFNSYHWDQLAEAIDAYSQKMAWRKQLRKSAIRPNREGIGKDIKVYRCLQVNVYAHTSINTNKCSI